MPASLLDAGGTALDGKIYVVGGKTATSYPTSLHIFDPATQTWTLKAGIAGRENPAVVGYNGGLYVFGGSWAPSSGGYQTPQRYDPVTSTWTSLAPMSTPRNGPAAVVVGSTVWVMGGMNAAGQSLPTTEKYDLVTGTWSAGPSMSISRDNLGAAYVGGQLYAFGGRTRHSSGFEAAPTLSSMEVLDPAGGTWQTAASMPTGRRAMAVGVIDGRIVAAGGERQADNSTFPQTEIFDPATGQWTALTNMTTPRHGPVAAVIDNKLHVIGGGPVGSSSYSNTHEILDLSSAPPTTTESSTPTTTTESSTPPTTTESSTPTTTTESSTPTTTTESSTPTTTTESSTPTTTTESSTPTTTTESSTPPPTTTTPPPVGTPTFPLQVDFGTEGTTPAAGYALDFGQSFGTRSGSNQGTGNTFGWVADGSSTPLDLVGSGRIRSGTGLTDTRLTTLMHFQYDPAKPGAWEVAVPNGTYTVTVGLGDAANSYDSSHAATVEGQVAVAAYTPTSSTKLKSGSVTVPVNDGRITVRPTGGTNVKITYLTVEGATAPAPVTFPFKVDFGASSSTPAANNVLDFGQAYGPRSAGQYGWVAEGTSTPKNLISDGRQRSTSGLADVRQSNFMHMQYAPASPGAWELAVPNGTYRVTAGVGDASYVYDSTHVVLAEGQTVISAFTPNAAARFQTGTADVAVTDGKLTIAATGGTNTKLTYLEVLEWDAPPAPMFPVKVDFGAGSTAPAPGYLLDAGGSFGARSGGYSFGWVQEGTDTPLDLTKNGRQRYTSATADPRLTSMLHMQYTGAPTDGNTTPGAWELAVPNGVYEVTVGVGDANAVYDSSHAIEVESVLAIAPFTPTANSRFATGTKTVGVVDGRLTIDAIGGANTKIGYADIKQIDTTRPRVGTVAPGGNETNVVRDLSVTTELVLPNGATNPNTVTPANVKLIKVSDESVVPSSANTSGGGDVLVLTALTILEANTEYRFVVTEGVEDVTGRPFLPFESLFTTGTLVSGTGIAGVAFTQESTVATGQLFTSATVGPDHQLYAATLNGYIFRYPIAEDGSLGSGQQIDTIRSMNGGQNRTIIGLTFDPASTADNLILWTTDNFMYIGNDNVPDWSSKLVRLTGPNLTTGQTVLTNLPRSAHDHEANSISFGPDGALYFSMGSNTGMGFADIAWANRPEVELAGAILRLDTAALPGQLPLDVKTVDGGGSYDPHAAGAPLTLYATGVRNAFDLLWHSNGQLYAPTNGSAAGANIPAVPDPLPASCATKRPDVAANGPWTYSGPTFPTIYGNPVAQTDFIHKITQGGYYGHPNPARCEYISYGGNPTGAADAWQDTQYPVGVQPDRNFRAADVYDAGLHASANGVVEYQSDVFGDKLKGKMLVVRYSAGKDVMVVDNNGPGGSVTGIATGVTGFSGFTEPLDIAEDSAGTGVLYVTELGGQTIKLLRPQLG